MALSWYQLLYQLFSRRMRCAFGVVYSDRICFTLEFEATSLQFFWSSFFYLGTQMFFFGRGSEVVCHLVFFSPKRHPPGQLCWCQVSQPEAATLAAAGAVLSTPEVAHARLPEESEGGFLVGKSCFFGCSFFFLQGRVHPRFIFYFFFPRCGMFCYQGMIQ